MRGHPSGLRSDGHNYVSGDVLEFYHDADTAILLWNTGEVWVWTRSDGKVHRDRAAEIVQMHRTDAANAENAAKAAPAPADSAPEASAVASAVAIRALAAALARVEK